MQDILNKSISEMSAAELELREVFELISEIKTDLRKAKTVADYLLLQVQLSHSLIVVRKIGEDKLDALKDLLD